MKLKKSTKGFLVIFIPFLIGYLLGLSTAGCASRNSDADHTVSISQNDEEDDIASESIPEEKEKEEKEEKTRKEVIYYRNKLNYKTLFKDINEEHLAMAKKVGLDTPPRTRAEIPGNRQLVKIKSNRLYTIYTLKYSSPYLTRGAASELNAISQAFKDSLRSKNLLDEYRVVVSSVLRSEEDVKNLRKSGNPNASENSAHCYGTTFDIAYTIYDRDNDEDCESFMQPFELTKVLGEVLIDRKKAGKCLVKYEKKEHCFHITATY